MFANDVQFVLEIWQQPTEFITMQLRTFPNSLKIISTIIAALFT